MDHSTHVEDESFHTVDRGDGAGRVVRAITRAVGAACACGRHGGLMVPGGDDCLGGHLGVGRGGAQATPGTASWACGSTDMSPQQLGVTAQVAK